MNKLVPINQAEKLLCVSTSTLRRWNDISVLIAQRTETDHRRYNPAKLTGRLPHKTNIEYKTIAYARVSSRDQTTDLERQIQVLEPYCAKQGLTYEIIND